MGAVLHASTRPSDLCARLGGDEFAVLLVETGADGAAIALERLRLLLATAVASDTLQVTSSVGAVTFLVVPDNMEAMVRAADAQMYMAKTDGKNRVRLAIAH